MKTQCWLIFFVGITSFEERKPLFDVRRPAFLKAAQKEAQVHTDKGNEISNLNDLKCKENVSLSREKNGLQKVTSSLVSLCVLKVFNHDKRKILLEDCTAQFQAKFGWISSVPVSIDLVFLKMSYFVFFSLYK